MNANLNIAVLYHIFYEDTYENLCLELNPLKEFNVKFLFNICDEIPNKTVITNILKNNFPGCFIITTSNKGKDLGAKMGLIQLIIYLNLSVDLILFLHDKKSLQALKSATWKKDLLKIIAPEHIESTMTKFIKDDTFGIIGTKEYIIQEEFSNNNFIGVNHLIINKLLLKYHLKPPSYHFVAGTMFWVRAKPLLDFFIKYDPLVIRADLEDGNVIDNFSGTNTHTWERLLSWIISSSGYKIIGV